MVEDNYALSLLLKEKNQSETALNNIMKAIEQGVINKTTNKRMKELEEKVEDLDIKIIKERIKLSEKVTEEDIREYYEKALKYEAKLMIGYLVKEIRLYDDKIEIYFNSPIDKSPDESQGFLLYKGYGNMPIKILKLQERVTILEVEIYG